MKGIAIKGSRGGLRLTLGEEESLGELLAALTARLTESAAFFQGAEVTLDVGTRELSPDDWRAIAALLLPRDINLQGVSTTNEASRRAARTAGLTIARAETPVARPAPAGEPGEEATEGWLIKRTLRSGQSVRYSGHVVVLGDVNPGAEVVASGDIVVWGSLRGVAHAGALGDEAAVVCALHLAPTQLRIAGRVARPPEESRRTVAPEMARVQGNKIIVEAWRRGR
jgi:septum site-determining protein MinC